jgi:hypothetical protein
MGKLGRIACIAAPALLSLASFICLLLVFLGGLNKNDSNLRGLYYFSANTTGFKANSTSILSNLNSVKGLDAATKNLIQSLVGQVTANNLKDYYYIYMWNYCSGSAHGATNGSIALDFCSPRKSEFYFNPITEWGLNGTIAQNVLPGGVNDAMKAYQKGAQWMFIAYVVAFWTTVATMVVGLFAVCSRVGSCLTTVVSLVATLFTFLAALTSTILFSILVGALDGLLKPYQIKLSLGSHMLAVDWLAVAFSLAASLFWTISICCCSGRSKRKDRAPQSGDYGPTGYNAGGFGGARGYQPLGEEHGTYPAPYGAKPQHGMEMQNFGTTGGEGPYKGRDATAYEPFRHA